MTTERLTLFLSSWMSIYGTYSEKKKQTRMGSGLGGVQPRENIKKFRFFFLDFFLFISPSLC